MPKTNCAINKLRECRRKIKGSAGHFTTEIVLVWLLFNLTQAGHKVIWRGVCLSLRGRFSILFNICVSRHTAGFIHDKKKN